MSDQTSIHQKIEAIVAETAERHAAAFREALSKRLLEELNGNLGAPPGAGPTDFLNSAIASVQDAVSQTDILKSLLDGAAHFSRRTALFVVRGNTAAGWQSRGFPDNDAVKSFATECNSGLTSRVVTSHTPAGAAASEFDPNFVQRFGAPSDGNVLLLPLVIKNKVAAVIYADGGPDGATGLDRSAMELLVRSTGLWLEVLSFRKAVPESAHPELQHAAAAAPAHAAPPPAPAPSPAAEDEVHSKARRFAKLLVEEIKLYNQQKVQEGRTNHDLYDRLKEDIDKSKATYERRYGQTITDVDYFSQELVRILADNDRATLGANFRW